MTLQVAAPALWRPAQDARISLDCGGHHPRGHGRLDETARRLSHEEYHVARLLAGAGHHVVSVPESRRGERRPDLQVCGWGVEVKSFLPAAERLRPPGVHSVHNKLLDASGQGEHVVLFAVGSGLEPAAVRRGLARYAADPRVDRPLRSVRVLGDGFDLAWVRSPGIGLARRPQARRPLGGPDLGL